MKILNILIIAVIAVSCGGNKNADNLSESLKKLDSLNSTMDQPISTTDIYTSPDNSFRINFGGTPNDTSKKIITELGDIEMVSFTYEKSATEAYMVAYSDYPSEAIKASSADDLLNGAKEGALTSQGGKLESEEKITLKGYPGYNFKAVAGTYYMCYRIFLKGNRLFQILIIKDGTYPAKAEADAFMDSFELIENK